MKAMKKRVLAFGTFDLLHPGHIYYLKEAKKLGAELVVVVARDKNAKRIKGRMPVFDERHRLGLVSELRFVSRAVLGDSKNPYKPLRQFKPAVVALGYDQKADEKRIRAELRAEGITAKVVRMKAFRPGRHKSSVIRERFLG